MYQEPCARCASLEANLEFAQERAANNHVRATIGEAKIAELVAEIRDLKAQLISLHARGER